MKQSKLCFACFVLPENMHQTKTLGGTLDFTDCIVRLQISTQCQFKLKQIELRNEAKRQVLEQVPTGSNDS